MVEVVSIIMVDVSIIIVDVSIIMVEVSIIMVEVSIIMLESDIIPQSPLMQELELELQSPLMHELELELSTPVGIGGASDRVILTPLGAATAGSLVEESRLTAGRAPARERRPEKVTRVD